MKKILYYTFVLASLLSMGSCTLDREPETTFSDVAYWKTEKDLRGACTRLYNLLEGFSHDTRGDELVKTSSDATSSGNRSVPSTSSTWSDPYARIFTANNIIQKAAEMNLAESAKNRWVAEAKFFRAYYYFSLVQKYGDVPLILKAFNSTNDPEIIKPRDPREDVIQQCYKDLDFAAENLPTRATLSANDWGRLTRSAALAMKLRIALFEGTFIKYHNLSNGNSKEHLKVAIDAAEAVMKEGHTLYPDYQKLFYFEGEGAANKENIFVKIYGPNEAGTVTHGNSRQMENSVSLTRQMIDLYLYEDGLPKEKSPLRISPETSYDDALTYRDPRLAMTVFRTGEEAYKGTYNPLSNQSGNGYSLKKGFMLSEWQTNSKETVDKMLIRYGEVLISYAEALFEYNGSITDAQLDATVNMLRQRANFNVKLSNAFVSSNNLSMLDEIRRERTVELIDEGFRYNDIIRWKIAENVLPKAILGGKFVEGESSIKRVDIANRLTSENGMFNGQKIYDEADIYVIELAETRSFNPERDYLYPVPLEEISLSKNNVTQNPNWE